MANNWETKNASHKRLETASWKAAALTSLGLWCWNRSAALGCVSTDLMDTELPILSGISETAAKILDHSCDVHT